MAQVFNANEVFAIGIQIEKNGKEFYSLAAKRTDDAALKELFEELSEWENRHISMFQQFRNSLPDSLKGEDVYDPENSIHLYLKAVADSKIFINEEGIALEIEQCKTSEDILEKAIGFEKDSVVFYSAMKEIVSEGLGKVELDTLVYEELNHIGQLTRTLMTLRDVPMS